MGYRERWLSEDGKRLAEQVFKRLQRGRSLDGLGLQTVDGRIDLRGFTMPEVEFMPGRAGRLKFGVAAGKLPEIRKARLSGVDLSESRLRHLRLTDVRFDDCMLRGADLTDFGAWRSRFDGCDLSGADLADSVISAFEHGVGNVWYNCSFNALVLDGVVAKGAEFRNCSFEHVEMANIVFEGCSFVDCRVTGSLEDVSFYGRNLPKGARRVTMENFDLRHCRFTDVAFVGLRLSGVRLPQRDSIVVVPQAKKMLEEIRSALAERSDELPYLSFKVSYMLNHVGPDDDLYLDYDDINRDGGESSVALLREVISRVS